MHGDAVLNLKDYNEKRRGYLHEWHVPIEEDEADNDDENEIRTLCLTGNEQISFQKLHQCVQ